MKKVFVIDPKFEVLLTVSRWFNNKGYFVKTFSHTQALFDALVESVPDAIVVGSGYLSQSLNLLEQQVKENCNCKVPVVLFSDVLDTLKTRQQNISIVAEEIELFLN